MKKSVAIKTNIFDIGGYILLLIAGTWTAIKGDFTIATLVFFGLATLMTSPMLAGNARINPSAKENMPDIAEIKHYREQHPDASLVEAINAIVEERDKK